MSVCRDSQRALPSVLSATAYYNVAGEICLRFFNVFVLS